MVVRSQLFLLVVLALCPAVPLTAQVVNIEGRRFSTDTVPWQGYLNFRYQLAESSQRSVDLGLNGAVQFIDGRDRFFFINDLAFSRVEGNKFVNTGFQHLRYNMRADSIWTGEAFLQAQYNKPMQLDLRLTAGAGPRLTALNSERMRVNIGVAFMLEREHDSHGNRFFDGRNSNYVSGTLKFSPYASLTAVVYYQPKLLQLNDHRISVESGLLLRFNERFSFESRFNLLKDSRPPEGVETLTYSWNNLFGFRF